MGRRGLNREEGMEFGPQGLQMSLKGQVVVVVVAVLSWSVVSDSAMPRIAAHQAPHPSVSPGAGSVSCPSCQVRLG